jgi:hypothetical protein
VIKILPDEIKIHYEKDVALYYSEIEKLKLKSISAKHRLLTEEFESFPVNGSNDDKAKFVVQFLDFLLDLTLFPDLEVFDKLRELKFAKHTLKWMVKLEDITNEIERLNKIEGLFFLPNSFLSAVSLHLSTKFFISFIEDFELSTKYNNADTNILVEDFDKRFRRREYNDEKNQTPKMDWFDQRMNNIFDFVVDKTKVDKSYVKKIMLQSAKGNTSNYYTLLDDFYNERISKNKVYLELFPLLKLIMKDVELLSYDEYINSKEEKYDADYTKYQIARIKKILKKK